MRMLKAGDRALVVEFGDSIDEGINRRVHALTRALDTRHLAGIDDLVPTYRSVLIYYDPRVLEREELERHLMALADHTGRDEPLPSRVVEIPTCYGGDCGPDLPFVAEHTKLSVDEVIRIHAGTDYLVYMMGFTAGFPYLGGLSPRIAAPRLETPRTRVPAGSVGIAQQQTGIYPSDSPGGWRIIGRTPVRLFDPHREPPVVIEAGDYVRFVPIDQLAYDAIDAEVRKGHYVLTVRMNP